MLTVPTGSQVALTYTLGRAAIEESNRQEGIDSYYTAVRTQEGLLIGTSGIQYTGNVGVLCDLAVHPEYRRMGIAHAMTALRIAPADHTGVQGLVIPQLSALNTLDPYYERHGFALQPDGSYRRVSGGSPEWPLFFR